MNSKEPTIATPWYLTLFRCLVAFCLVLTLVLTLAVANNEREFMVALLGFFCVVAVSIPLFMWRTYDLFEPMTLVILLVIFGTPFKIVYALAYRHEDAHVASHVLFSQEPEVLLYGLSVALAGLVLMVMGYMLRLPGANLSFVYLPWIEAWNGRRLQFALLVLGCVSLLSFLAFIAVAGVNFGSLAEMSEKRFGDSREAGSERMLSAKYFLYRGAALSKFVVYFCLIWICRDGKPKISWLLCGTVVFLLQTMMLAFVMDSRANVILILIDCVIIYYFMLKTIDMKIVFGFAVVALMLVIPMLATRGNADKESPVSEVVKKTLTGRNMLDIAKTCHIINGVPKKMEYRNGEMLYAWMCAPIPKSLWPEKPMWANKGVYLNQHIFGYEGDRSGCPPGLIAELYWDFGKWGVWIGMFMMGILLRQIYLGFRQHSNNMSSILIYTLIISRFVMFSLGMDLGTGIVKAVLDLLPVVLLLHFVGMRRVAVGEVHPNEIVKSRTSTPSMELAR